MRMPVLMIAVLLCLLSVQLTHETLILHSPISNLDSISYKQHISHLFKLLEAKNRHRTKHPVSTTTMPTTTTSTTSSTTPPTTEKPAWVPPQCRSAINLTEIWRRDYLGRDIKPISPSRYNCDNAYMFFEDNPWFRFTAAAGNRLMNRCVRNKYSCGSRIGLWSDDVMPTVIGERYVMHAYEDDCNRYSTKHRMFVMRCSDAPHDFIYRHRGTNDCYYSFCGMSADW